MDSLTTTLFDLCSIEERLRRLAKEKVSWSREGPPDSEGVKEADRLLPGSRAGSRVFATLSSTKKKKQPQSRSARALPLPPQSSAASPSL